MRKLVLLFPVLLTTGCIGIGHEISFRQAQKWHQQNHLALESLLEEIAACRPTYDNNDEDIYIPASGSSAVRCTHEGKVEQIQYELKKLKLVGVETHRIGNEFRAKFILYTKSYWTTDEVISIAYEPMNEKFQDSDTELTPLDPPPSKWFWSKYSGG